LDIIEENAKFVSHLTSYFETAVALSPEGVFDVNQLLNEAIHQAKVPSRIDIVTKYDPELPKIKTNRILVEVVVELITNSIKAISGKGTIEIASHKEDEEWIVLSCADSGCGIRPESHDRVFGMFYTDWQPMPDEEVINTGFGLWWVKAVVTKLGGLVAFDSEVNKGTTFYIRLPIKGE
jgi:signal transduction histidine kinase